MSTREAFKKKAIKFHDLSADFAKGKGKATFRKPPTKIKTAASANEFLPINRTPLKTAFTTSTMPSKPRKLFFKFEYNKRTYEGFFTHAEFMEHAKQYLSHNYPFLPKLLITSRAQTMWEEKMNKIMEERFGKPATPDQFVATEHLDSQTQKHKKSVAQNSDAGSDADSDADELPLKRQRC